MIWFKKDLFAMGKEKTMKVPHGLWVKCDGCNETIYNDDIERNLYLCPKCNFHFRVLAQRRVEITLDEGTFVEQDDGIEPVDALKFKDLKEYADRLRSAQKEHKSKDAFIGGKGRIDGRPVSIGAFEFSFMAGSMGSVVGERITRLIETAIKDRTPLIIFSASGGARMQEGILSLMQMAKTSSAVARLRSEAVPFISVLTDPTMGGVTASFAMLGDIILAEPKALIGFAGTRVIAETIKQKLPEGFQRSEYLLEHGMIDMIVDRKLMKSTLSGIISLLAER